MNLDEVTFRCFEQKDIAAILRIQHDNLQENLASANMADGFLSVAFSQQQFIDMNRDIPIVVAETGGNLGGYLCGCTQTLGRHSPLLAYMMTLYEKTTYHNKPLDTYRSFIYGPVCIDKPQRGKGLLSGLFMELLRQVRGQFDMGTLFISRNNPRSLHAHTHHLNMQAVRSFFFMENKFDLLVFDVPCD